MRDFYAEVDAQCISKNSYTSEDLAREVGRSAILERGGDLYVYPCFYCAGWHLIHKPRGKHWHVNTPLAAMDDYADILGDPNFWTNLAYMDPSEAEPLLRKTRLWLSEKYANSGWHPETDRIHLLTRRLKDELHALHERRSQDNWVVAIRNALGQEALDTVILEMTRLRTANSLQGDKCPAADNPT